MLVSCFLSPFLFHSLHVSRKDAQCLFGLAFYNLDRLYSAVEGNSRATGEWISLRQDIIDLTKKLLINSRSPRAWSGCMTACFLYQDLVKIIIKFLFIRTHLRTTILGTTVSPSAPPFCFRCCSNGGGFAAFVAMLTNFEIVQLNIEHFPCDFSYGMTCKEWRELHL